MKFGYAMPAAERESWRVLRDGGGYLIAQGSAPEALGGKLSETLAADFPWIGSSFPVPETFAKGVSRRNLRGSRGRNIRSAP